MAQKALTISDIRPFVLNAYMALVLLAVAVLSNFGLCNPPTAFYLP